MEKLTIFRNEILSYTHLFISTLKNVVFGK